MQHDRSRVHNLMVLMHCRAKREDALQKRHQRATGGGVAPPTNTTETEKVLGILGKEARDLGCGNDCDAYPCKF